jgi:hypothetical protein
MSSLHAQAGGMAKLVEPLSLAASPADPSSAEHAHNSSTIQRNAESNIELSPRVMGQCPTAMAGSGVRNTTARSVPVETDH